MHLSPLLCLSAAALASASKAYLGFNSGATLPDNSAKFKKDFQAEFETAQKLKNAPGDFNAVRLYTNIQAYSDTDPIEAFEAAIDTKTYLLLGVWASGTSSISKELKALQNAVDKFGSKFTDLVIGISIGSEDLYRQSATGILNKAGVGADINTLKGFISDYKKAFAKTALADVPVGHVDTGDMWANSTNEALIEALDWIGLDQYPFYESGKGNQIDNSGFLFDKAYNKTIAAANGKPIWVTETGWAYTGPNWDEAVSSVKNAKYYWDEIGCRELFGKVPTFWYNLRDSNPANKVKFAITDNLSPEPRFDLTCPKHFKTDYDVDQGGDSSSSSTSESHSSKTTKTSEGGSKPTKTGDSSEASSTDSSSTSKSDSSSSSSSPSSSSSAESSSSSDSSPTGTSESSGASESQPAESGAAKSSDEDDDSAAAGVFVPALLSGVVFLMGLAAL